jgi:integrase
MPAGAVETIATRSPRLAGVLRKGVSMASISLNRSDGTRRILFIGADGVRRPIYLGKFPQKAAETVKRHVEAIVSSKKSRSPLDSETAEWLGGISDDLHGKLEVVRLVQERVPALPEGATTLGKLIADFEASKLKAKPATRTHWGHTWRNLVDRFGASRDIASITEADAGTWAEWLDVEQKLSLPTIRKRCGNAKQLFDYGVRQRLIASNPFAWLKSANVTNTARRHFLERKDAERIIEACPDAEWRLLFALSRYGGLRCPSEHLSLRWDAIDWERARMLVKSPKTEHHQGRASRVAPIFPELRPFLDEAWEQAEPGAVYVITRYRSAKQNLRTQFQRIIRRAGLQSWPKLFHNLRSAWQTELENSFPTHVVCAWLGNSPRVARENYLQVTEDHFARAQMPADRQAAQQPQAMAGNPVQAVAPPNQKTLEFAGNAAVPGFFGDRTMGDAGLEPATSWV